MQPKRDPSDRRFWPARLGGTGAGFTQGRDKTKARDYYGALGRTAKLGPYPRHLRLLDTVPEDAKTADPEAVRVRARLLSLRLMDRLDAIADSMDGKVTADALNAAGKLTGVQVTTQNVTGTIGHLHLDALRQLSAERRPSNSSGASATASARMLPNVSDGNVLDVVPEDSASLGRESDGGEGPE